MPIETLYACPACGGAGQINTSYSDHDPMCDTDDDCDEYGCPVEIEDYADCVTCDSTGKLPYKEYAVALANMHGNLEAIEILEKDLDK